MNGSKVVIGFILGFILLLSWGLPVLAATEDSPASSAAKIERLNVIIDVLDKLYSDLFADQELTKKELNDAKASLEQIQVHLDELKQQLSESSADVKEYKNQLEEAQRQLQEAQEKLAEREKKMAREIKSLTLQRNIAAIVAILALIF